MTTGRRARLAVEIGFVLAPGLVFGAPGLWCLRWADQRVHRDNQRDWAMGIGLALLGLGVVLMTLGVLVMAVYSWREGREHPQTGGG